MGAESIVGVVGCEPPEVYCLKHEYQALLPNRKAEIQALSKNVFLVEEFIMRVAKLGKLEGRGELNINKDKTKKAFFHPHCHQRAEGELASVELLKMFGFDVELSDAGCCGMAGTFGFEAEHYDLSMQIGELKLLPRVREFTTSQPPPNPKQKIGLLEKNTQSDLGEVSRSDGGGVVSSGSACRIQIRDGAGVEVQHPLVLIRDALYGSH